MTEKRLVSRNAEKMKKSELYFWFGIDGNPLKWISDYVKRRNFNKEWYDRNEKHGEIFVESLALQVIPFQQTLFIEQTDELMLMLGKLGFRSISIYPDAESYKDFVDMLYWEKYNITLALWVKPVYGKLIKYAITIATETVNDVHTQKNIFFNTMKVLLADV